ncbi:alpha/beta fold hydrolase [Flavobacterium sp.]|uniref:alpha/beta fold hydrolase n=1 Tax=Flavobacterium sp. TaxID=239 RepID=UPI0039E6B356
MKTITSFKMVLLVVILAMQSAQVDAQNKKSTGRLPAALGREEYIEVEKNVRLHVTDLGQGQPIVLIHGWPLSDEMYEYQYQFLVKKGFRVIGITLRGFGHSDKPYGKYDYDVFADDIKVVLDKLNIQNAVLGGFSMGGATVLHYTAKYNNAHVGKLVLFAAAAPSWARRPDYPYGTPPENINGMVALNNSNRPELLGVFGGIFGATENALPAGIGGWLNNINLQASSYAAEQCLLLLRDADLRPDMAKIKVPTALFYGKKDKIVPFELAEVLHQGIKKSKIVVFENSGHALFLEEMEKFNNELLQFAQH